MFVCETYSNIKLIRQYWTYKGSLPEAKEGTCQHWLETALLHWTSY